MFVPVPVLVLVSMSVPVLFLMPVFVRSFSCSFSCWLSSRACARVVGLDWGKLEFDTLFYHSQSLE